MFGHDITTEQLHPLIFYSIINILYIFWNSIEEMEHCVTERLSHIWSFDDGLRAHSQTWLQLVCSNIYCTYYFGIAESVFSKKPFFLQAKALTMIRRWSCHKMLGLQFVIGRCVNILILSVHFTPACTPMNIITHYHMLYRYWSMIWLLLYNSLRVNTEFMNQVQMLYNTLNSVKAQKCI